MKTAIFSALFSLFALLGASCAIGQPQAQNQTRDGSIEFVARATPSGGLDEPVRGFPFYLLNKSYEEIRQEADVAYPKPDMNAFIDSLEVSKELKAWMKKNQWVNLSGEDFIHKMNTASVTSTGGHSGISRRLSGQKFRYAVGRFSQAEIQSVGQSEGSREVREAGRGIPGCDSPLCGRESAEHRRHGSGPARCRSQRQVECPGGQAPAGHTPHGAAAFAVQISGG